MSRPLLFASVVVGVIYIGLMLVLPPEAFFSGDEGIKWLQVDSIRRHWWTSLAVDAPGEEVDPSHELLPAFLVTSGGAVRSIFPAGYPLVASFPYAILGTRGIYLVSGAAAILCMFVTARLARLVLQPGNPGRISWADGAGIAAVVATPLVFYGATIWEHTLAVLLVTAALIPLTKALGGDATGWHGAAAGLLLGCAAAVRTETALIAPAAVAAGLIVAGWKGFGRQAMTLTMGVLVILVPRAYLHRQVFGSWLPPHLTANPALQPLLGAYDLLLPVAARGLVTVLLVGSVAFGLMGARLRWRPPQFALTAAGLSACAIILGNLLADLVAPLIDPRIKLR